MLTAIENVKYNPYRDLNIYPIDDTQVDVLVKSLKALGQFASLPARVSDSGGYEIAAGHHRLEAMRKLGKKEVELSVDGYDEDQMVAIMSAENATQKGHNSASTNDAVAAAVRRLAEILLVPGADDREISRSLFTSAKSASNARRTILDKGRLGRELIHEYFQLSRIDYEEDEIGASMHALITSGALNSILEKVKQEAADAAELLEAARLKAEADEKAAKDEKARKAAEKKRKEAEKAQEEKKAQLKRLDETIEKKEAEGPTLAGTLGPYFKNTAQQEAFVKFVTDKENAHWFPVEEQEERAKQVVNKLRKENDLSAKSIAKELKRLVKKWTKEAATEEDLEAIEEEEEIISFEKNFQSLLRALGNVDASVFKINAQIQEKGWPRGAHKPADLGDKIDRAIQQLRVLRKSA